MKTIKTGNGILFQIRRNEGNEELFPPTLLEVYDDNILLLSVNKALLNEKDTEGLFIPLFINIPFVKSLRLNGDWDGLNVSYK